MRVPYSYLDQQFADAGAYFDDLRELVRSGEFTLGPYVEAFEKKFAARLGVKHAIGTNTGTDALILALKAVGVRPGDEVITVPNTFVATVGAIVAAGAKPLFVDCDDRYQMDATRLKATITRKTRAIVPVHWTGASPDLPAILDVARQHDIPVVEDACPAFGAAINGKPAGTFGRVSAFSMHPLKPLNVWGDGGVVVTSDDRAATFLRLYRNHGLKDRDHVEFWGVNNRLQPVQAVVGSRLLDRVDEDTAARIQTARLFDEGLRELGEWVRLPRRPTGYREVYQLYVIRAARRDELMAHLAERDIEARVHYPVPLHLQKAALTLGYRKGDFPECEAQAREILTLPCHQFVTREQAEYVVQTIREFYQR